MDYKDSTIDYYDKNIDLHQKKATDSIANLKEEIDLFLNLMPGKRVLDIGCGTGVHALLFKEKGKEVVGIDDSEGMIEHCKKQGLDVRHMDMERMRFDQGFDGVWATTSLLHLPKSRMQKMALEISKILNSKGALYVSLQEGEGEEIRKDGRFFSYWKKKELQKIFEKYFNLINFRRIRARSFVALEFHFRKK